MEKKYIVCQLGARMHYAVPKILQDNVMLEHFYTDITVDNSWPKLLKLIPDWLLMPELKRLKARRLPATLASVTKSFPLLGLEYAHRLRTNSHQYSDHFWAGDELNRRVIAASIGGANATYTFNSAGLELMKHAKRHGLYCVMEQTIAPKIVEIELLNDIYKQFPDWRTDSVIKQDHHMMIDREYAEWELADKIICGSEFVRQGIGRAGGDLNKCVVVPYGVSNHFTRKEATYHGDRKLRVLVAGQVGLRKGSPFVLNIAKRLTDKIEVRMAGPVMIPSECRNSLKKHVQLMGAVPRNRMIEQFHWADVLFLPSICEGSATVTYEALCVGLPVICTENTGSIVQDGFDGFVVKNADEEAMVRSLESLADNVALYESFATNTNISAQNAGLDAYSKRLISALS